MSEARQLNRRTCGTIAIGVDGWHNPIELAGAMVRAGDDDSPEELTRFLRQGAMAIKQLHDQIRDMQRDALDTADERAVTIISQQDGHIFKLRKQVAELTKERDEARFRPGLGDNHHNAAACPYCTQKAGF